MYVCKNCLQGYNRFAYVLTVKTYWHMFNLSMASSMGVLMFCILNSSQAMDNNFTISDWLDNLNGMYKSVNSTG